MTPSEILGSLVVLKSGNHTHYASRGYFLCSTHQNSRKVPVEGAVTCSKCTLRHLELTRQEKELP